MSRRDEFVQMMAPLAIEIGRRYGLDPRLIIAQAAQETGWGEHVAGGNLFGVKSHGQPGGQSVVTTEYVNGQPVTIRDNFRAYNSVRESMEDYANFLRTNPRYSDVFRQDNFEDQAKAVAAAGYATDPNYADSLISIGRNLDLAPYSASQAAESVSYGNDLGQVPPPVPVPMPAGLRGTSDRSPREHNLSTIKFNSAPFANLPYPIEQASVQTDPRIAFHPITMDRRYSPPASVPQSMFDTTFQRVSDAERMARDRLTQPQVRVASAPDIPMPRPRPSAPPRTTADEGLQSLIARRSEPSALRRNEEKAERLMNVPTADQRLQSQINANPLGMGVATTAPFIPGEHWKPRPRTIPEAVPEAPISRRNEMRAEGMMDNPIPRAQAPVPAMAPANLRGDPLAHITPMSPTAPIPAPPYQRAPVPVSPIQRAAATKRAPLVGPNTGPVKSTVAAGPSPWGSQSTGGSSGSKVRLNSGSTANTGTYQGTNGYRYRVNNDGSVTNLDTGITR